MKVSKQLFCPVCTRPAVSVGSDPWRLLCSHGRPPVRMTPFERSLALEKYARALERYRNLARYGSR